MNDELILIENKIYEVRGTKVMLDFDLAELYGIETRTLKQAVRRNIERFPKDFMFMLTKEEANNLIHIVVSQNVISPEYNVDSTNIFAFTENGVSMLSSVLRSPLAIQININIMRIFTRMRQLVFACKESSLSVKDELEQIKVQLSEIAEDLDSNEQDHESLFNAIAEISLKLQLNQSNPGHVTVKGFTKNDL
ncbi:ORF6N domain-containing protein [uncultured Bacteroides sp.]|uniref:ORF6N domain-containing protein n=1 Tax=uncultured Bacteroides sp. TaxID=162156 RepID=UPI002594E1F8|nr:ORF6N domain-containing protein [uncultured Bacteroides sp.]